jgi:nucleoside-diphosphate-sugar epimerase
MNDTDMCVLVTGATGFVGKALLARLERNSVRYVAAMRKVRDVSSSRSLTVEVGEISSQTSWRDPLAGVSTVVHLAARVHVMRDKVVDPLAAFREVNTLGTLNLARQAAEAGVKRFIFVSSIKVNGEVTQLGSPFTADDAPAPLDPYGISKMEAEQGLLSLSEETGMEVVIIRPPLVYGPGVKANFAAMMRWLKRGVPLPLGAIHNQRSLVSLDNLVDLMVTCLTHPVASGQVFLVSDGEDVSTTELLRRMAHALGCTVRLIPVPVGLLKLVAAMVGKRELAQRLCESLQVNIDKTHQLLGWRPPITLDQGLKKVAEGLGA